MICSNCYIEDDHWTSKCPLKKQTTVPKNIGPTIPGLAGDQSTKCVPKVKSNQETSITISNLPKFANTEYLQELAKPFGRIKKIFIAKYRDTNDCRGYAFVHFKTRSQAAEAIKVLNGRKCDNLILSVDWSDPPVQSMNK
ncbi:hypothetical protein TSAR_003530 [Trichomalopsis sarcophagae]|uniref:RRM domain-containing protein n=1 Tax=Trichomalopsis sarcophagae TaxID=543379 RepID=A0A232FLM0_9HYME|nr:hypothetical protein TSAR_003530 [Trichomalopsis sarcophagae]